MKRLLLLLSICALAAACNNKLLDLDGTQWKIYLTEDRLNGKVVYSQLLDVGTVDFSGDARDFQLTIKYYGESPHTYGPEDVQILRSNSAELVFDMFYYELEDVAKEDCNYEFTYKGTKIYRYDYIFYGAPNYCYVYFKPNGTAVDVGGYTLDGDDYWYDLERFYCRRAF